MQAVEREAVRSRTVAADAAAKRAGEGRLVVVAIGIAVRQEDNDLREKINKALDEIRADGTYKKINDKYFSIDVYTMK